VAGRLGTPFLAAVALSDMWTQSTGALLQGNVLAAFCADPAVAIDPMMAAVWFQVTRETLGGGRAYRARVAGVW
jgi:hypothetical protein